MENLLKERFENVIDGLNDNEKIWLTVLRKNKNYKEKEFINNFLNKNNVQLSLYRYRKFLIEQQNNIKNLDKQNDIMSAINNKNVELIKLEFEEMFLEPISLGAVNMIFRHITSKEKLTKIIQMHNNKKIDSIVALLML